MKKILKRLVKIAIIILLIISLLITISIVAGSIYKDEIKNFIVGEINSEIEVKLIVKSVDFSLLRKFPFVSVVLTDAAVLSGKEYSHSQTSAYSTDTLFTASRIYLQFNILDIIREDYRLRRVHAVDGKLNILVDKNGKPNYRIFKESINESKSEFTLGLDGVKISNFIWSYRNLSKQISSHGQIRDISLKGEFSQSEFSLNSLSSVYIETFNSEGIEYASGLDVVSRLILNVHDSVYNINKGEISVNNMKFIAGGSFTNATSTDLNLQLAGENLDIKSLVSILPANAQAIAKYSPAGNAGILVKFKGIISSTETPSVHGAFKVSKGKIVIPGLNSLIEGIKIKGTYSNGTQHNAKSSRILLNEFSVNYKDNLLTGKLSIDNFMNPFLSGSLSGTIIAKDLSDIIKVEGLKFETGFIYPEISVNMSMDSFNSFRIQNISTNSLNGNISFKEISGMTPYSDIPLNQLEGNIKLDGETWYPRFTLKLGKNIFNADLVVHSFWEYIVNKTAIPEIVGEINSDYFLFTDFLPKSDHSVETDFHMPDSIMLNLHCKVDSFFYGKFAATDLETQFSYKPSFLTVSSLKMQTMKGKIMVAGAIISNDQGQMSLRASGELRNIDINKLFYTFNNFWQTFIVADNLKGSVTGKIDFSGEISPKLELQTKNLIAQSDFVIEDGELINFEPVNELSTFVELSELKHIKFSTLKNSVLIKNEKVYIPQMDISSSAFNLSVSGIHGFDNHFEYKLKLRLSEILARKARKAKKENEEFGVIEEGETGSTNLYLSITGTPDNFKIRYDKKEAITQIKSDLKEEKKLLKNILREELGLFKKDSAAIENKNNNSGKDQFIMDWGDADKNEEKPADNVKTRKKQKKKDPDINITWEEEETDIK